MSRVTVTTDRTTEHTYSDAGAVVDEFERLTVTKSDGSTAVYPRDSWHHYVADAEPDPIRPLVLGYQATVEVRDVPPEVMDILLGVQTDPPPRLTHRGCIEYSAPPRLDVIAVGPYDFVRQAMTDWLADHPMTPYDDTCPDSGGVPRILAVVGAETDGSIADLEAAIEAELDSRYPLINGLRAGEYGAIAAAAAHAAARYMGDDNDPAFDAAPEPALTEDEPTIHGVNCSCDTAATRSGASQPPPLYLNPDWSDKMREDVTNLYYLNQHGELAQDDVVTLDGTLYKVVHLSPVGVDVRPVMVSPSIADDGPDDETIRDLTAQEKASADFRAAMANSRIEQPGLLYIPETVGSKPDHLDDYRARVIAAVSCTYCNAVQTRDCINPTTRLYVTYVHDDRSSAYDELRLAQSRAIDTTRGVLTDYGLNPDEHGGIAESVRLLIGQLRAATDVE